MTIKDFFKNKWNWALLGVLLFTLIIRLYFLYNNIGQAQWWDSSEYLGAAKHIALNTPYWASSARLMLFPLMMAPFFYFGVGEIGTLIFEILCITGTVFLIYKLTKKFYDDKTAIIASFVSSVIWVTIFWSIRATTDFPALFFQVLTIYAFFNFIKIKTKVNFGFVALSFVVAFFIREETILLIPLFALLFLLIEKKEILKYKKSLCALVIAGVGFGVYLLTIGKNLMILPETSLPIAWAGPTWVGVYLNLALGFLFVAGVLVAAYNIFLTRDLIKTNETTKGDVLCFLTLFVWFGFFVFYLRNMDERWLLMILIPLSILIARGSVAIYNFVKKFNKLLAVLVVLVLLSYGAYQEIMQANTIINNKALSYFPVKEAGLWLKQNSDKTDWVVCASVPQMAYYSERNIYDFYFNLGPNQTEEQFNNNLLKYKPKFLVLSVFEPGFTPTWAMDWPARHKDMVTPAQGYFLDAQQKQPALIIYILNYNNIGSLNGK